MKKYDLLKTLGVTFFIVILLSWVIPGGNFVQGSFTKMETQPVGLFNIFSAPIATISTFAQVGLLFLAIGGFYGVLNNTGVYSKIVENITKKYEKNRNKVILFSIIFFGLLASIIGSNSILLILVPFAMTILLNLGFSKVTTLAATVGSILVGNMGSTFGTDVWSTLFMAFKLKPTQNLLVRIILLLVLLIVFGLTISKKIKSEKIKKEESPLYKDVKSKREAMPLIVISILMMVVTFLGLYHWREIFGIEFFNELHESLMTAKIAGYPLFANILGSVSRIGYWGDIDLIIMLILASLIISWIYNIKFNETIDAFIDGSKEMIKPAIYAMLSLMMLVVLANLNGNFLFTMVNKFISGGEKLSIIGTIASALVTSPLYNNFYIMIGNFYPAFVNYGSVDLPIIGFIFQTIYGLIMLIAPTSMLLISGCAYLNISYKDWVKYIWQFFLIALVIAIAVIFIIASFL